MKNIIFVFALLFSLNANAAVFFLQSCEYKYLPEYGRNVYIGVYKSQYGNYFTKTFRSYCPQTINQ